MKIFKNSIQVLQEISNGSNFFTLTCTMVTKNALKPWACGKKKFSAAFRRQESKAAKEKKLAI